MSGCLRNFHPCSKEFQSRSVRLMLFSTISSILELSSKSITGRLPIEPAPKLRVGFMKDSNVAATEEFENARQYRHLLPGNIDDPAESNKAP